MEGGVVLRLNVGCGPDYRDGWTNLDTCGLFKVDARITLPDERLESMFGAGTVDEIYMCDVMEHFYRFDGLRVLRDFLAVLKPGGRVTIVTPDLERLITSLSLTLQRKTELIRGAQGQPGPVSDAVLMKAWKEYPRLFSHPYTWTQRELWSVMADMGFKLLATEWRADWEMVVRAVKPGGQAT